MKHFYVFFSNLNIKKKIQLFGVVTFLLLWITILIFYGKLASNTVLKQAKDSMDSRFQEISSYMDTVNVSISSRLSHLDTSITVQKIMLGDGTQEWSVNALLQDIQSAEQIEDVELYTVDGHLVAGTNEEPDFEWMPDRQVLKAVRAMPGKNYWHDDANYFNSRTNSISIYRAICVENTIIGIARVELSDAALSNLYARVGFSGFSEIYLFSSEGNVMLPKESTPAILRIGRDSFENHFHNHTVNETYYFQREKYLVQNLFLDSYNLYVVCIAPYSSLMENVHTLQMTILLFGLIFTALQLSIFSFMGDYISKPITALSQMMTQVGKGNLDLRSNSRSNDEIGFLSRSFDETLDRIQNLITVNATSEKRRHELELISLQTQIAPHFLYNSLDCISALAQLGDMDGTFQMSKALGGFYRNVLSDGRCIISVKEELQMTDNYLRVQLQRYQDGFEYHIDVAPEILQASIVKLTIQPLVENAIYHGIRNARRKGIISITGRTEDCDMILSIRDNGAGMSTDNTIISENHKKGDLVLHRKGYGMYNADQRIKLYFGNQYGLQIESVPKEWTQVNIRIPLCPYKEYQHDFGFDR